MNKSGHEYLTFTKTAKCKANFFFFGLQPGHRLFLIFHSWQKFVSFESRFDHLAVDFSGKTEFIGYY